MKRNFARITRWLHVYLSMFSFATLMFFAFTGLTLNHTDWIEGKEKVDQVEGDLNPVWVQIDSVTVQELQVVEFLRNKYSIRAPLSDFVTDESECTISFKGPGFIADSYIDRSNGHYQLTITRYGMIAIMNDLHKGRDTGTAWAWLIDISAILMILVSLSGFLMIFILNNKRTIGLVLSVAGLLGVILVYYFWV